MRKNIVILLLALLGILSCQDKCKTSSTDKKGSCTDKCQARNNSSQVSCKLTTPELQKRKETVLASLKKQVIEKKQLTNGYAYKFAGSDTMLDELTEFIKTERECCDFFTFNLSISGDKTEIWLELTGVDGAKDFIDSELNL